MTIEEILKEFNDINHVYNDCMKYDTLKRMLEILEQERCEDGYKKGYKAGYARAKEELTSSQRKRIIAEIEKEGKVVKGDEVFLRTEHGLRLIGFLY